MEILDVTKEISNLSYMLDYQVYHLTNRDSFIDISVDKICALQKIIHGISSGNQIQFELDRMSNKKHELFSRVLSIYNLASRIPPKLLEESLRNTIDCMINLKLAKEEQRIDRVIPYFKKVVKNTVESLEIKKSVFKLDNVYDASIFNLEGQIKSDELDSQIVSIGPIMLDNISKEQSMFQGAPKRKQLDDKKIKIKLTNLVNTISGEKKIEIETSALSNFFVGQNRSFISINLEDHFSSMSLLRFVLDKVGCILKSDLDSFLFHSSSIIKLSEPLLLAGKLFSNSIELNKESLQLILKEFGIKMTKNDVKKNADKTNIYYHGLFSQNILSEIMMDIIMYSIEKKLVMRKINTEDVFDLWVEGLERYMKISKEKIFLDLLSNTNFFAGKFGIPAKSILSNILSLEKALTTKDLTKLECLENYIEEVEKTQKSASSTLSKKNQIRSIVERYINKRSDKEI